MIGMDAATGRPLAGDAHLAQSIATILMTPIGSCACLRDFGSAVFELLDAPLSALTRLRLFAAAAVALARWEPRIRVTKLALAGDATGAATLEVTAVRTDTPAPTALTLLSIPLSRIPA